MGMNHTSSKAALRDRLLFNGHKLEAALTLLRNDVVLSESFILSTCNRVELYAVTKDPVGARTHLLSFFSSFHGIPVEEFEQHLYFHNCHAAVEHFYNVVASLDSLVIGEYQILGQIKDAYHLARDLGATGAMLNKLFHFGIEAGKRVRTETKISDGVLSISSAAVDLAKKILGDLSARTALIIGAGEMSELTAKNLASAGINKMYFANRTIENAVAMAEKFNGAALLLDDRRSIMPECDIVISSTGAPDYIILPDEIKSVMAARKHRALFLIDIAAPRDIHPDAGKIQNVFLYSIDDLSQVVAGNTELRRNEIGKARAIIQEDLGNFYSWYHSLKAVPTLVALRSRFEQLRDEVLAGYAAELAPLPEETRDIIRRIAASMTKKFLSNPSRTLKELAADRDGPSAIKAIAELFDLNVQVERGLRKNVGKNGAKDE
jgi:glutamyl-tRNA reductase